MVQSTENKHIHFAAWSQQKQKKHTLQHAILSQYMARPARQIRHTTITLAHTRKLTQNYRAYRHRHKHTHAHSLTYTQKAACRLIEEKANHSMALNVITWNEIRSHNRIETNGQIEITDEHEKKLNSMHTNRGRTRTEWHIPEFTHSSQN